MEYEDVIKTLEIAKAEVEWNYPLDYQIAFDYAIEALNKQSNIVHCKDCEWWENPIQIQGLKGNISHIGMCELTKWLCGEQGYCMYGREVE